MIVTPQEASRLIGSGRPLLLTGAACLLRNLPHGRWIGAGGDGGEDWLTCLVPPPAREIRITRLPPGAAAGVARLGPGRSWLLTPGDRLARRLGPRPVWRAEMRRTGDLLLDGRCGMTHAEGALVLTLRE
ncbi:hypothetical protein WDZ11_15815 [Roseomonas mucosa]|uniref:Uncharacterized protein n=1 Tax=Roseomonas mucosa TaxID=207340 RepID=A0A1S8D9L8_9PROT|nr:hypothetical protein [Roseomonas mucosa]MDT8352908.1 hypothetical protein [Roseomonas mucosa]ONH85062.1 hypothetical protein APZ41_000275 [Roseomonas mucosa]